MVCVCRWALGGQIKVLVEAGLIDTGSESDHTYREILLLAQQQFCYAQMAEDTEAVCKVPNRNRANGNVVNACIRHFRDNQKQLKRHSK